ncbi:MAG: hypothetical protein JSS20_22450 [Proteobacteria bacterium]|nr:hypothetical protein [Pseudomonadota bacterium]
MPIESASAKAAKAKLLAADPALRGKLTLAARNAADSNGEDDEGLGNDLAELERDASDKDKA